MGKAYDYQDSHQEKVIHSRWEKGNSYRYLLEASGDIFRELVIHDSGFVDKQYIFEKTNRIRHGINSIRHMDDTHITAFKNNKEKFRKMISYWKEQPLEKDRKNYRVQVWAVNLNLAMLNGHSSKIFHYLDLIEGEFE